ncbi:hypothetical protein FKM82_024026 [Ascaphus truei]
MGDAMVEPVPANLSEQTPTLQGNGGSPLCVITEGVVELSIVIDPDVAQKACEDVLEKVKLMHGSSVESLDKAEDSDVGDGTELPNGDLDVQPSPPVTSSRISEEDESLMDINSVKNARRRQKNNSAKQSWLLRLFECKLFDISMAISYLYNSKEPGVQAYIGNRLFYFKNEDVDFYLPQLLNMYIHMDEDVGDAIKPYVVHRCRQSINFSLQCAWLLGAYSSDMHISAQRYSRGTKLRKLILSDELKPAHKKRELPPLSLAADTGLSPSKRTHQRSKSDATASISLSSNLKRTASNPKVENNDEYSMSAPGGAAVPLGGWQGCSESVPTNTLRACNSFLLHSPLFALLHGWAPSISKELSRSPATHHPHPPPSPTTLGNEVVLPELCSCTCSLVLLF